MVMRAWLSMLALAAPLLTAARPAIPDDQEPGLSSRLRHIEAAFREGDASSLRSSCTSTGKVRVDLRDLPEGQGSYGSGQLQAIFSHIFEESRTREFAFGRDDVTVPAPGTAFARGRWVRRNPPRGQETVDTLTFTLRQESGDWRILEIRSSR